MYQHIISSHQIFEPKALQDHSLSPPNGVHVCVYIYIYIYTRMYIVRNCEVLKAFYCVRYYDYMDSLFMQQLTP